MNELPKIGVVIPLHNHAHWIGDAISSVLAQNYPKNKIELFVVNDGSTDNSAKAVVDRMGFRFGKQGRNQPERIVLPDGEKYHGHINGVLTTLISSPKAGGPSRARNTGIQEGWERSELFALLDSDDMYMPDKLILSVRPFLEMPEVGVVYSDYTTINENKLRSRQYKEPYSRIRIQQECLINCDSLVSKRAFEVCGFFDESLRVAEDYNLWRRISTRFLCYHIPESLVDIRVGRHSSSAVIPKEVWLENYRRAVST